jgi:DNA-binding NtrC family response regulator
VVRAWAGEASEGKPGSGERAGGGSALAPLEQAERTTIQSALRRNRGNRSRAASELGIHRSTLIRKLKRYGIR